MFLNTLSINHVLKRCKRNFRYSTGRLQAQKSNTKGVDTQNNHIKLTNLTTKKTVEVICGSHPARFLHFIRDG